MEKKKILWIGNSSNCPEPSKFEICEEEECERYIFGNWGKNLSQWLALVFESTSKKNELASKVQKKCKKHAIIPSIECFSFERYNNIEDLLDEIGKATIYSSKQKVKTVFSRPLKYIEKYWGEKWQDTYEILLNVLMIIYDEDKREEGFINDRYQSLRIALQNTYEICIKYGIIKEATPKNGRLDLTGCTWNLAGRPYIYYKNDPPTDIISPLPEKLREATWTLLGSGNESSHSVVWDYTWMLPLSYALQLCELIIWVGEQIEDSQEGYNEYENNTLIGQPMRVEETDGILHCKDCLLNIKAKYRVGETIVVEKIVPNTDKKTKDQYPYFALKTK